MFILKKNTEKTKGIVLEKLSLFYCSFVKIQVETFIGSIWNFGKFRLIIRFTWNV